MGGNNNNDGSKRQAPSTSTADNKVYLNKMIIIIGGRSIGLKGKVTNIANRGWWTIDNPKLKGKKVTAKLCRLVNSMSASHVKYYESKVGTVQSGSRIEIMDSGEDSDNDNDNSDNDNNNNNNSGGFMADRSVVRDNGRRSKRTKSYRASYSSVKKYKSRGTSSTAARSGRESLTFPFVPPEKAVAGASGTDKLAANPPTATVDEAAKFQVRDKTHLPLKGASFRHIQSKYPPVLSPLLLDPQDDRRFQRDESIAHLEPDSIIEVFNRKTGRIMRGKDGIKMNDLSSALRSHAEYEPVIPLKSSQATTGGETNMDPCQVERGGHDTHHLPRMARSSKNTRVSAVVRPQITTSNSIVEGCFITVTSGPYRGLIGRVVSCSPEGWCMISDLLDDDDQKPDVVVHSNKLKLIPTKSEIEIRDRLKSEIEIRDRLGNSSRDDDCVVNDEMEKNSDGLQKASNSTDANAPKEDTEKERTTPIPEKNNNRPLFEKPSELVPALPAQNIKGSRTEPSIVVEAQAALNVQQLAEQMLGIRQQVMIV